jgi:hypothetical protein
MLPVVVAPVKPANTIFGSPLQHASGLAVWQVLVKLTWPLGSRTVAVNAVLVLV